MFSTRQMQAVAAGVLGLGRFLFDTRDRHTGEEREFFLRLDKCRQQRNELGTLFVRHAAGLERERVRKACEAGKQTRRFCAMMPPFYMVKKSFANKALRPVSSLRKRGFLFFFRRVSLSGKSTDGSS